MERPEVEEGPAKKAREYPIIGINTEARNMEVPVTGRPKFFHEFNGVRFPSESNENFRCSIASVEEGGVQFWFEHKKNKQQWQCTVEDLASAGSGRNLPEEVILESLKVMT